MPDVNDDMDELFRKAGENYPLNTDSSDWNEVHKALQPHGKNLQNKGSKKRYLPLLLLLISLPFVIVVNKYVINPGNQKSSDKILPITSNKSTNHSSTSKHKYAKQDVSQQKGKIPKFSADNDSVTLSGNLSKEYTNNPSKMKEDISHIKEFSGRRSNATTGTVDQVDIHDFKNSEGSKNVMDIAISDYQDSDNGQISPVAKILSKNYITKEDSLNPAYNSQLKRRSEKPVAASDTSGDAAIKKAKKPKTRVQHFYAGIVLGPDVTTVKLQKVIKTGFTAGIIAGYKLNKRWSIESGFYLDKKYYYTTGKYFSTKHVYIPSYTKIEDLDGYCLMIELPVNFKYNFSSREKVNWHALIGSSSYLMKKEDYGYRYKHYGQIMEKTLSYKNSSNNWAAVVNLAVGYSRNVGKTGNFRIEPYLKIPLKGVGTGSLPITSSGVYLGFTKKLF